MEGWIERIVDGLRRPRVLSLARTKEVPLLGFSSGWSGSTSTITRSQATRIITTGGDEVPTRNRLDAVTIWRHPHRPWTRRLRPCPEKISGGSMLR